MSGRKTGVVQYFKLSKRGHGRIVRDDKRGSIEVRRSDVVASGISFAQMKPGTKVLFKIKINPETQRPYAVDIKLLPKRHVPAPRKLQSSIQGNLSNLK